MAFDRKAERDVASQHSDTKSIQVKRFKERDQVEKPKSIMELGSVEEKSVYVLRTSAKPQG